jgi:outer membrane protein TolC
MQMIRPLVAAILLMLLGIPASAQAPLSLADAIARARRQSTSARSAAAAEREAAAGPAQARAGYLPRVDFSESWQRGNDPVFVFSSLLAQRRFTTADFAVDALNHPAALSNFRTGLIVEQPLLNAVTPINIRIAALRHEAAQTERALVDQRLAVEVTEIYGQVVAASGGRRTTTAALEAATASRTLALNRREAGLATDADVLQVDVHLARVRQRAIQSAADEGIARARLNALIGEPLDANFTIGPITVLSSDVPGDTSLERTAIESRPDVKRAALNEALARAAHDAARATFVPEVTAQAGWEGNGTGLTSQSASWIVGAVARVNLFRGLGDRARLAETRETMARRAIEREEAETQARLDVRIARARLEAARARLVAGRTASDEARESHRIIRDRYEGGLADIVSLLRASEAVVEAEEAQVAAEVGVVVADAELARTLGK